METIDRGSFDAAVRAPVPGVAAAATRWPLERVLFALAGTMTLLSVLLTALVSRWFLVLTAFVGVNQWLYVVVGACPASIVLRRALHLRSAIYDRGETACQGAQS